MVYVEINLIDAERFGIAPGELVSVRSRRGQIRAGAFVTNTVQAGKIFIPMHNEVPNQFTFPAFDPYARQASYKPRAVRLGKI